MLHSQSSRGRASKCKAALWENALKASELLSNLAPENLFITASSKSTREQFCLLDPCHIVTNQVHAPLRLNIHLQSHQLRGWRPSPNIKKNANLHLSNVLLSLLPLYRRSLGLHLQVQDPPPQFQSWMRRQKLVYWQVMCKRCLTQELLGNFFTVILCWTVLT